MNTNPTDNMRRLALSCGLRPAPTHEHDLEAAVVRQRPSGRRHFRRLAVTRPRHRRMTAGVAR